MKKTKTTAPRESEPEVDTACPACGSEASVLLGILGNLIHFRCRACGIDYSRSLK